MNIVVFDGECLFCNRFITFIIQNDKKNKLFFCELQSKTGIDFLKKYDLPISNFETIYFVKKNKLYEKSDAILKIMEAIGGIWKIAIIFSLIPKLFRNKIYNFIAEHRFSLSNSEKICKIPDTKILKKILY